MRNLFFVCLIVFGVSPVIGQWTASGTHIYNSNSGNVGVGNTNPSYKLDVNGSIGSSSYYPSLTLSAGYWGGNAFAIYSGVNTAANSDGDYTTFINPAAKGFNFRQGSNNIFALSTSGSATFSGNVSAQAAQFTSGYFSGNVGIGNASPSYKLDVNGSIGSSSYYPSLSLAAGYWGGNAFAIYSGVNITANSDGDYTTFINPAAKGFNFRQGSNNVLTITSGNVGIGTESPFQKLSVDGNISANGTIIAKKITVTQTGWSDYVFNNDYPLRSLKSLESFIQLNKHLPEIPSEKEVREKGIDLGDTQALLLKKIEELTLYVIAIQKENNSIKQSHAKTLAHMKTLDKKLKRLESAKN